MRLIDADVLRITHSENCVSECGCCCGYGEIRSVDGSRIEMSTCDLIESAPTIDAIPVEWLRGIMLEYAHGNTPEYRSYAFCMNNIIEEWQKEQEAG